MGDKSIREPMTVEQAVVAALAYADTHRGFHGPYFVIEGGGFLEVSPQAQPVLMIERRGGSEILPTREQVDAVRTALAARGRTVLDEWIGYAYGMPTSVSIRVERTP